MHFSELSDGKAILPVPKVSYVVLPKAALHSCVAGVLEVNLVRENTPRNKPV